MKSSFHQVACSQYNSAAMPIADGSLFKWISLAIRSLTIFAVDVKKVLL